MIKQLKIIIFLIFITEGIIRGQYSDSGLDYQMVMRNNPGFAGAEGDGFLRLSYLNYYPGQGYNLFTGSISYDGYFPALHGGMGFFVSNDYMGGIINDFHSGVSYAYYFQAGKGLFISAGLSASLYHRGYNLKGSVLPEQIDPVSGVMFPSGETISGEAKNVLDLGTGFLFMTEKFFWGIAVSHLTEPDIDYSGDAAGKIRRKLLLNAAGDYNFGNNMELKIRPLVKCEVMKGFFTSGAGAVLEGRYLSLNAMIFGDREKNFDLQTGFAVETGKIEFFYNYRFNISSGNNLLPFSLFHQTGMVLGLNNVEKRRVIKTIKYPNL